MRISKLVAWIGAVGLLALNQGASAEERVPPEIAAKRSGKIVQATPTPPNLIYRPIAPCRVFSKRVNADVAVTYQISGTGNFTSQGGPPGGCGVPNNAKAVAITLSTLNPAKTGSITSYAAGSTRPGVVSARFNRGLVETTSSNVDLSSGGRLTLYPSEAVSVIGDITGYYESQLWAYIDNNGSVIESSGRVISVDKSFTGYYKIDFDRDISFCAVTATTDLTPHLMSAITNGQSAFVSIRSASGSAVDYFFNVIVIC